MRQPARVIVRRRCPARRRSGSATAPKCSHRHHEACAWAAQPEHGSGDLVAPSKPTDRLVRDGLRDVQLAPGDHVGDHRRLDGAGAHRVNADAAWGVLERGALREAEDAVLGGVVGGATGVSDQAAERGAVDDRATALLAHHAKLVLHTRPDTAEIDAVDAVERFGRFVCRVDEREHDACVVER